MNKELIIRSHSSAVDFALLKDGKLIELNKEVEDNNFSVGDIFVGKVRKAMPGLNAAFVDVGHDKDGFLHYHDLGPKFPSLVKYIKQISTGKKQRLSIKTISLRKRHRKRWKCWRNNIFKTNCLSPSCQRTDIHKRTSIKFRDFFSWSVYGFNAIFRSGFDFSKN